MRRDSARSLSEVDKDKLKNSLTVMSSSHGQIPRHNSVRELLSVGLTRAPAPGAGPLVVGVPTRSVVPVVTGGGSSLAGRGGLCMVAAVFRGSDGNVSRLSDEEWCRN